MTYVRFFVDNFAGALVFYVTFQLLGPKPAIAFVVATCVVQVLIHRSTRQRFSPLFWFSNGTTVALGIADLLIQTPRFLKFEPGFRSLIPGVCFLISLAIRKPLAGPIMETMPGFFQVQPGELDESYLTRVSWVCAVVTLSKAALFFHLAYEVSLGELWVLKKLLGGAVVFVLFGSEAVYRKWIRKKNPGSDRVPLPGV